MELDISFDEKLSTHSRAEAAATRPYFNRTSTNVSTHSRAEVAARHLSQICDKQRRFNTQPRGVGCQSAISYWLFTSRFNTQPRGGGC